MNIKQYIGYELFDQFDESYFYERRNVDKN